MNLMFWKKKKRTDNKCENCPHLAKAYSGDWRWCNFYKSKIEKITVCKV